MVLRSNIFAISWAFLIFVLSLISGSQIPSAPVITFDKILHISFYLVLSMLTVYGLKKQYSCRHIRSNAYKYTLAITSFYGLLIEYIQPIVADRYADFWDFLANFIGCCVGLILFRIIYKI